MTGPNDIPAGGFDQTCAKARDAALRFIAYRARSEHEVRRRLSRSYSHEVIERVIAGLRDSKYLDDAAFARQWRSSRERRSPRGEGLLRQELRQLGVSEEVIGEALAGLDAEDSARRAAEKLAGRLAGQGCNPEEFRRRVWAHLRRRGYELAVIRKTANLLWQELGQELAPDPLHGDKDTESHD